MKKILKLISLTVAAVMSVLLLASCAANADAGEPNKEYYDGTGGFGSIEGSAQDSVVSDRKIIKNVRESIQTDRYDDFMKELKENIAELGGYISSQTHSGESYYNTDRLRSSSLEIRIPADRLADFTSKIENLAVVVSYNEYMNDVTGSYVDVESRIAVLAAEEAALLEMLEKAVSVADTLEIRSRLNAVQSDLASYRAQKAAYDSLVAYSTVSMNVSEVRRAESVNPGFFEEVGGNFTDSLYSIGRGFRSFGVWLLGDVLYILLFIAVAGGISVLGLLAYRRLRPKLAERARNARCGNSDEKLNTGESNNEENS